MSETTSTTETASEESTSATNVTEDSIGFDLCKSCSQLELNIEKFIVSKKELTRMTQSVITDTSGNPADSKEFELSSGTAKKPFATLKDVQAKRRACPFCGLVCRAVERYSRGKTESSATLFLSWEVDGRQTTTGNERLINRTRRIRLSWREKDGKEEHVYLVLVAPTSARRPNSDAYAAQATQTHFLGRGRVDSTEKQALIKSWIDLCVKKHDSNCQKKHGTRAEFKKLIEGTFFGVIDVTDMQLKALPVTDGEPARYVALSYVWGKRPVGEYTYTTTRVNVMVHIQHGGLEKAWDQLPKTIQDTVLLVSRLGERYVWIDSLYIVQDSISSWELNAKSMHLVYGNAHFTICAADGEATTGLRAVEPILRTVRPELPRTPVPVTRVKFSDDTKPGEPPDGVTHSGPLSAQCSPGIRLLVSKPTEAVIQDSLWDSRAWVFQERLLSRRCLIFAEGQVYFQCRSAVMSQDIHTDGGANGWSLDWTNSPLRTLGELRRRAFWFYMKCVRLYTGRKLTKPQDVLTAFEGTSWLLQQHLNAPLFYGLPSSHFDLALLWMPLTMLNRRKQKRARHLGSGLCSQDELGVCNCKLDAEDYGGKDFPSWSWCGWIGGKAGYQLDMIEGCLLNVRDWLKNHTWILWYVRDLEGNLRPLWDKSALEEDLSEDLSWKGYSGKTKNRSQQPITIRRRRSRQNRRESSRPDYPLPPTPAMYPQYPYGMPPGPVPPYYPPGQFPIPYGPYSHGPPQYVPHPYPPVPHPYPPMPLSPRPTPNRTAAHGRKVSFRPKSRSTDTGEEWAKQSNEAYLQRLPTGYYDDEDAGERSRTDRPYSHTPSSHSVFPQPRSSMYQPAASSTPSSYAYPPRPASSTPYPFMVDPDRSVPRPPDSDASDMGPRIRSSTTSATSEEEDDETSNETSSEDESDNGRTLYESRRGAVVGEATSDTSDRNNQEHHGGRRRRNQVQKEDVFGRPIRPSTKPGTEFTGILPDNPFGIIRGPFPKGEKDRIRAMPILQFWTWRTELYVTIREPQPQITFQDGFRHCDIVDKAGDWCGSIILPRGWITARQGIPLFFIAISDARTLTAEECPVWNYYIPKEKDESEWDLYYVMLLERNRERALWERVGLGKVFQAAFGEAVWDEIKLG